MIWWGNYNVYSNIPTHAVWSSLATSSPTSQIAHLSSKSCIDPGGHAQNSGFAKVGTLSPGQTPKIDIKYKLGAIKVAHVCQNCLLPDFILTLSLQSWANTVFNQNKIMIRLTKYNDL